MRTDESYKMVQTNLKNDQSLRGKHPKHWKNKIQYFMKNYMFLIGNHEQT